MNGSNAMIEENTPFIQIRWGAKIDNNVGFTDYLNFWNCACKFMKPSLASHNAETLAQSKTKARKLVTRREFKRVCVQVWGRPTDQPSACEASRPKVIERSSLQSSTRRKENAAPQERI